MLNYFICNILNSGLSDKLNTRYKFNTRYVFRFYEPGYIEDIGLLSIYDYIDFSDVRHSCFMGPVFTIALRLKTNKREGFIYDLVKRRGRCAKRNHIQDYMFFIGV